MTELKCPVDGCHSIFFVEPALEQAKGKTVDCPNCGTDCMISEHGTLLTMRFYMSQVAKEHFGEHKQFRHGFLEV